MALLADMNEIEENYFSEYLNGDKLAVEHKAIFKKIQGGDIGLLHFLIHKEVCIQNGTDYIIMED